MHLQLEEKVIYHQKLLGMDLNAKHYTSEANIFNSIITARFRRTNKPAYGFEC